MKGVAYSKTVHGLNRHLRVISVCKAHETITLAQSSSLVHHNVHRENGTMATKQQVQVPRSASGIRMMKLFGGKSKAYQLVISLGKWNTKRLHPRGPFKRSPVTIGGPGPNGAGSKSSSPDILDAEPSGGTLPGIGW